jgi:hypothetical protein
MAYAGPTVVTTRSYGVGLSALSTSLASTASDTVTPSFTSAASRRFAGVIRFSAPA